MGTFSQVNIKSSDFNLVLSEFKKAIKIGKEEWIDDRKEWLYNPPHGNNITIIASKNQSLEWIEFELDFGGNLYVYDEYLRRLSKSLNTKILLGYYQSTTGDGRLAKFEKGQMEMSFYEKYFYFKFHGDDSPPIDRIYVADNFGANNSKISELRNSSFGVDSSLIDHDFIHEYFKSEGWLNDSEIDYFKWKYLHLEQIK